ncbi:MAG: hypothetical protein LBF41_09090 [Deltaproteobacteria bacterium]|jgi:hypothetical protein|nr:hypothetical protein [Deltaproteobacteria bacterium]
MINFLRAQLPTMLLSVVLAFIVWLFVAGRDMLPREIKASLIVGPPPPTVYVDPSVFPQEVSILVNANTAQYQFMQGRKLTVRVDLDNIGAGEKTIMIDLPTMLSPGLPRGISDPKVQPAELTFIAHRYLEKRVPVYTPSAGSLPPYLKQTGALVVTPPAATVRAPEDKMEFITEITTDPLDLSEVKNSATNSAVVTPNRDVSASWLSITPNQFTAAVPVEFVVKEETFDVPINVTGLSVPVGPSLPVRVEPKTAMVRVVWRGDRQIDPTEDDVSLTVDLSDSRALSRTGPTSVPVIVKASQGLDAHASPEKVTVTWFDPENHDDGAGGEENEEDNVGSPPAAAPEKPAAAAETTAETAATEPPATAETGENAKTAEAAATDETAATAEPAPAPAAGGVR